MAGELTRAFIAIEFGDEAIKEIARVQEVLEKWNFTGKMTELENLHLTLKFLGEIDDEKLMRVKEELRKIKMSGFELKLGKIGIFHHNRTPRIIWIKVLGKEIYELQKKIDGALEGIFPKERRFMGHLTVARIKYVKDSKGFEGHVKKMGVKEVKFNVNEFKLKKSELKKIGPVYSDIECYKLEGEKYKVEGNP